MKRNTIIILASFAIAIVIVAAVLIYYYTLPPSFPSLPTTEVPEELKSLLPGALEEGELVIYNCAVTTEELTGLTNAFQKWLGFTVEVTINTKWSAAWTELVLGETGAGKYLADVYTLTDVAVGTLLPEGLLDKGAPELLEVCQAREDSEGRWFSFEVVPFGVIASKDLPEDLRPTSFEDFINPKPEWVGKVTLSDPRAIGSAYNQLLTFNAHFGLEKTQEIYEGFAEMEPLYSAGWSAIRLIETGQYVLGITVNPSQPLSAMQVGSPIEWVILDEYVLMYNNVGIPKNRPHPNLGTLFAYFMLSREGGEAMAKPPTNRIPAGFVDQDFATPALFPHEANELEFYPAPPFEDQLDAELKSDLLANFATWMGLQ